MIRNDGPERRDDVQSVRSRSRYLLMQWPWVSRARLTDAKTGADATVAFWRRAYEEERVRHEATLLSERARYDALATRYHTLVLAGGAPPVPPLERAVAKPPDAVTQAMIMKAKGSRILLKQFSEFVADQRLLGTGEAEIARLILAGVDDDAGVPG